MKKKHALIITIAALMSVGALIGCQQNNPSNSTDTSSSEPIVGYSFTATVKKNLNVGEVAQINIEETNPGEAPRSFKYISKNPEIATVNETGLVTAVAKGSTTITINEETNKVSRTVTVNITEAVLANGGFNYASSSGDEAVKTRTEILGKLEKYAMDQHLTGITLFENGGYVKYASRVQLPTTEYITGYGFGLLTEGTLKSDMPADKESNEAHRGYLHSATSSDPGTINAKNDTGSQVSSLEGYITSSFWSTKMNKTKNGYVWYPVLAQDKVKDKNGVAKDFDRPIPMYDKDNDGTFEEVKYGEEDPNPVGLYKRWRVYVKTGDIYFRYQGAAWEGHTFELRPITIDDYEFAYRFLLTGAHKQKRGKEMAYDTSYGIRGAMSYYNKTENADNSQERDTWNNMKASGELGIKTGHDNTNNSDYIEIELVNPIDRFTAMYQLSSNLLSPMCEEFVETIGAGSLAAGAKRYGTFTDHASLGTHSGKIMDMTMSVGPFMLEQWHEGQDITFKRNDTYNEAGRYNIPGLKLLVIDASSNADAIYDQFNAGVVDNCSIPYKHLQEEEKQPGVYQTRGDSTFKLNVNSCDQATWDSLFKKGVGKINPEGSNWEVKPWMSNDNFLKGLFHSIDRQQFAGNRGVNPSINYFADSYLADPEKGISYNDTEAHKEAVAAYQVYDDAGNSLFGYSYDKAVIYFKTAVKELVKIGAITRGTKAKPTIIKIHIRWMYETDITDYGNDIKTYFETAFNDERVSDGTVKLEVEQKAVKNWQDVYNEYMMKGQFDLAFGAISGNTYNPLNFLEVLKSDNSSGFTLNWGTDTSVVDSETPIIYDDKIWSFDALWAASDHGGVVENGKFIKSVKTAYMDYGANSDFNNGASFKVTAEFFQHDSIDLKLKRISIYVFYGQSYVFVDLEKNPTIKPNDDGSYTINIDASTADAIRKEIMRAQKIDDPEKESYDDKPFIVDNYGKYWTIEIVYDLRIKDPATDKFGSPTENVVTAAKNKAAWKDE